LICYQNYLVLIAIENKQTLIKMKRIKNFLLFILVGLTVACSIHITAQKPSSTKDERDLKDGLVACFPFDGSAKDMSGNHNDGIAIGATLTDGRDGKVNSAYYFDGEDDYITVNDSKSLRITGQITMSAWFKTDYCKPFSGIICKAEPVEPRHGYLLDIESNNLVRTDLCFDHSQGLCGVLTSRDVYTDNQWHHVVVVYDGREIILYIDGYLDSKTGYSEGLNSNTEPLLIGWDMNTWISDRHFQGSIDDVRIYNRVLSSYEILQLYNNG
jgi:hypothetical protein